MAPSRLECHICDKDITDETKIDDDPFGMICVICEDKIYGRWMDIADEYPLEEH